MDSPWFVASPFGASPVPHAAPHLEVWGMGVLLKRRGSVIPKALVWSLPCAIITAARHPHSMASGTKIEVSQDGWIWMVYFPISMEGPWLVVIFQGISHYGRSKFPDATNSANLHQLGRGAAPSIRWEWEGSSMGAGYCWVTSQQLLQVWSPANRWKRKAENGGEAT